jgi:glycine/D-amino acid oxidase-like deaminating enzyme
MSVTVRFRRQRLAWRRSRDEGLLVDLERAQVHRFDAEGARLVESLMAGESIDATVGRLATDEEGRANARRRLRKLVADLEALGVLRVVLPASAAN